MPTRCSGARGVLLGLLLASCHRSPDALHRQQGTTVYLARQVRTLDPERPIAEALAVRGGKLLAVGSRREVLDQAGGDAEVIDLGQVTVVPGLVDAHGHLESLGKSLAFVGFEGTRSEAEVIAKAAAAGRSSYQGDWLVGRGWDQNDWPEGSRELPGRAQLDARFPSTPVFLCRVDGHAAWVNGEALRRVGVTAATVDPPGGRILRDAKGAPTGVLVDNAIDLVEAKLPKPSEEQRQRWLKAALERCAKAGLTGVHDAGMSLATFTLLQQWDAIGALPLRVYAMAYGQGDDAQTFLERGPYEGRHLTLRAVKFLADGALGSRGAALEAPYSDEPASRGLLLIEPAELEAKARAFSERGFQVAVHAIGDRANARVLDLLGALEKAHPGARPRIEHAQVLRPEDIGRFAQLGVIASMQPTHATSDMPWALARLGPARLAGAYAWKSLLNAKAALAFGSDFPVESPSPLLGLYAARTRQDEKGAPEGGWTPTERLSGEEALEAFTRGAAYASFSETRRGQLRAGFDADFVALSVDPVAGPAAGLLEAQMVLNEVDGVEVAGR